MVFTHRLWCVTGGGRESPAGRQPGCGSDSKSRGPHRTRYGAAARAKRRASDSLAGRRCASRGGPIGLAACARPGGQSAVRAIIASLSGPFGGYRFVLWVPLCAARAQVSRRKSGLTRKNRSGCSGTPPTYLMHVIWPPRPCAFRAQLSVCACGDAIVRNWNSPSSLKSQLSISSTSPWASRILAGGGGSGAAWRSDASAMPSASSSPLLR